MWLSKNKSCTILFPDMIPLPLIAILGYEKVEEQKDSLM